MSSLENRLRDATHASADLVTPETEPPPVFHHARDDRPTRNTATPDLERRYRRRAHALVPALLAAGLLAVGVGIVLPRVIRAVPNPPAAPARRRREIRPDRDAQNTYTQPPPDTCLL